MSEPNPPQFGPNPPDDLAFPKWLSRAIGARWLLLAVYVALSIVWYWVICSQFDPIDLHIGDGLGLKLFAIACLLGIQILLLSGAPHIRWPRPRRRRSIFLSLAAGAAIAVLLSVGVGYAIYDLYRLSFDPGSFQSATSSSSEATAPTEMPSQAQNSIDPGQIEAIAVLLSGWILWFLIFALVGSAHWSRRFRWMYRTLVAGTFLELLITIPVDAAVRRKTNCYCGEGTFLGLIFGLTAILWTFGPGVAILFFVRRNQLIARSHPVLKNREYPRLEA